MSGLPISSVLLALAWFAGINVLLTLAALALTPIALRSERGGLLLFCRLLAAVGSALFALNIFLPAHWRYEPGNASDSFGVSVYVLAAAGVVLLLRMCYRAARVRTVSRSVRASMHSANDRRGIHRLPGFGGVSLAGVVRTRILVGDSARLALSPEELELALAHEAAHRTAYDNLKRVVVYCAPDLFSWSGAARALEHAWHVAAEKLADARAVDGDSTRAAHLAAALVKVARLRLTGPAPDTPAWSTLHDPPLLETRVRRLLDREPPSARSACPGSVAVALFVCAVVALSLAGTSSPAVHDATEWLVRILP